MIGNIFDFDADTKYILKVLEIWTKNDTKFNNSIVRDVEFVCYDVGYVISSSFGAQGLSLRPKKLETVYCVD